MSDSLILNDSHLAMHKLPDDSIDLIYLDPPFMTGVDYEDFGDRWADCDVGDYCGICNPEYMRAWITRWHHSIDTLLYTALQTAGVETAHYLQHMYTTLYYSRTLLKNNGTLYLHCDDHAVHYLKLLTDAVFGHDKFISHIVWQRHRGNKHTNRMFGRIADHILHYGGAGYTFNPLRLSEVNQKTIDRWYTKEDENGRYRERHLYTSGATEGDSGKTWLGIDPKGHWFVPSLLERRFYNDYGYDLPDNTVRNRLDMLLERGYIELNSKGSPYYKDYAEDAKPPRVQNIWTDDDVAPLQRTSKEKHNYSTQKPLGLMSRIILSSTNPGDLVLDPYCGSGSTLVAAQMHGRRWIGIDSNERAIEICKQRLGL